jgi:Fur family transcriptional regulator, ferric uptake regulator
MRATKQRECIYNVLKQTSLALTIDDILVECQKTFPSIGIATINREINRLRNENKLEQVKITSDNLRFCLANKHHHHHFKCTKCNKVYDIDCGDFNIKLPHGFIKEDHEINIFGTCINCLLDL